MTQATPEQIRSYLLDPPTAPPVVEVTMAADVGNARTSVIVQAGQDRPVLIEMPSVRSLDVVSSRDVFDLRALPPDAWHKLGQSDHIIEAEGVERFVGQLAIDYARAQSSGRGSDYRYSDGTTTEFILAALRAAVRGEYRFVVRCATLLPISLWPVHAERAEKHLKQTWHYTYNGLPIEARFEFVRAFREAEAAYHGLPKPLEGRAIIIDGGGRTVNVALFQNGQYVKGHTIDHMGVEVALDAVDRKLEIGGLPRLTLGQRYELQSALVRGKPYYMSYMQRRHRIDDMARVVFTATAKTLVQELARLFTMEAAEAGAFVGGAAYPGLFGEIIHQAYPVIELAEDPENRNVFGAFALLSGLPMKKAKRSR